MSSAALKAVATDQVKRREKTIFDYLDDARVKDGLAAVAGRFLSPDRLLRLCINAVKKNPLLLKCDPQTVLGGMMTTAALGLEPNTIQQLAFLIPYANNRRVGNEWKKVYECQFQVGARGFVALAYRSPRVKTLRAEAIHDGDLFDHMMGSEEFLKFSKALKDRGELIGAFCHVHLADDFETACVLPLDEIHKIRSKSETWRTLTRAVENAENDKERAKALSKLQETPWFMWEDDMAAKSAIKKHAKQLPIASSDLLMVASDLDSRGEASTLDLKSMVDPDAVRAVVGGEMDAPALEHQPGETLEVGEDEQREPEHVQVPVSGPAATGGHPVDQAARHIDPADLPDAGSDPAEPDPFEQSEQPRQQAQKPASKANEAAGKVSYAKLADRLQKAKDRDVADLILDEGRDLPADQQADLRRLHAAKFPAEG